MQKLLEDPPRKKNAIFQMRTLWKLKRTEEQNYRRMTPPRRFKIQSHLLAMERNKKENYKRTTPFRRSPKYQTIFLGLCYSCNNFGHKAINFKAYEKNIDNYEGHSRINHLKNPHDVFNINYNNFGSLNDEVESYK